MSALNVVHHHDILLHSENLTFSNKYLRQLTSGENSLTIKIHKSQTSYTWFYLQLPFCNNRSLQLPLIISRSLTLIDLKMSFFGFYLVIRELVPALATVRYMNTTCTQVSSDSLRSIFLVVCSSIGATIAWYHYHAPFAPDDWTLERTTE
jgi:hypothetical protein